MAGKPFLTLDDLHLSGKTVLLRVDINAPIVDGRIAGTDRIAAAAETLDAICARGAKAVVLAHQGRKGDPDFTSLREHAEVLGKFTRAPVAFVPDVYGEQAKRSIAALEPGTALMLENVRGIEEETRKGGRDVHAKAEFVRSLANAADYFVNDAFSAAHRSQASLVGFAELLPNAAGLTMERELTALAKAVDHPEPPAVIFLGGAKPEDSIAVMKASFEKGTLDTALLGGLVANLFLHARGHELGKPSMETLEKRGILPLLPEVERLLDAHDDKIVTPEDVAVRGGSELREEMWVEDLPTSHPILDLGSESIATYREIIAGAGSLVMNGPAGLYEDPAFSKGTRELLAAFAATDAFSLMGGGHTLTAMSQFGHSHDDFGYVSLAGGALMAYLTGEELPAVEALRVSAARFRAATP